MSGEKDLSVLLSSMSPILIQDEFVFCTVPSMQIAMGLALSPKCIFEEAEGTTLIVTRGEAESAQLKFADTYRCITLNIHSSLEAVGLTAAVTTALTKHNISANVIAGYYHDHIFVPSNRANEGLVVLEALAKSFIRPF